MKNKVWYSGMTSNCEDTDTGICLKKPTNRKPMNTVDDWLEGKWVDDGAEGLWRVHDKLYDLTPWIKDHPGGSQWLEITKGTDITEAFECSHLTDKAEKILNKFYVRKAKAPRNSLITFMENGFYKTLKKKIRERNLITSTKPRFKTKLLADSLATLVFVMGFVGLKYGVWWFVASGVFLSLLSISSHNFFHLRDNWRMHYFNLMLMSVSEWRVSHVLSHHLYPNTHLDLEISMFEPFFRFLPQENKRFRYLSWLVSPFVMATMVHFQFIRRVLEVIFSKKLRFQNEEFVGFILPLFLVVVGGKSLWEVFVNWNIIIVSASFLFGLIGLTAAHHHPDIYHDGDFLGKDKDFGLLQLAAVRNRVDVDGNFVLTMVMFGEHALHHLFPTIDHSRLPALNGVFEETCREFNINFKPLNVRNLFVGMFQQLLRNYKNTRLKILDN